MPTHHRSRRMVPRPTGRCGRRNGGYKLIEAMGLLHRKPLYNYLLDLVRQLTIKYLDTSRTLSKQKNKWRVEKVVRKAQRRSRTLSKYEDGWAVRDMIAQYLRNFTARRRRVLAKIEEEEEMLLSRERKCQVMLADSDSDDELDLDSDMSSSLDSDWDWIMDEILRDINSLRSNIRTLNNRKCL